jgi:integrase
MDLPKQRFHDCVMRASFVIAQGVPMRVSIEVLGHSEIALTMNTYRHVLPAAKNGAALANLGCVMTQF